MLYSFIFPVHNEADFLNDQLNIFIDFANKKYKNKFEIILIENGSNDESWLIAKKLEKKFPFIRIHHFPLPSYGAAIRWGIINALGKKIFVLNVDYFDFEFIQKANKLLNTIDVVIGSKTLTNSSDQRTVFRRTATYFFNVFLRLILNYPGTDTHGIKAFRKSKKLIEFSKACRTQNELFDTELILRLTKNGSIFVDLPQKIVELRKSRYFGMRRFWSTFSDLISIIKTKYFFKKVFFCSLVDADDFGFSKEVNQAIINEAKSKTIDVVSIVPNLAKKNDLNNLKKCSSSLIYSMHLNLLRGKPCAGVSEVKSLVNSDGIFCSLPVFIFRLNFGMLKLSEIEIEFKAQYAKLLELGVLPTYMSSEQHLHILSPINKILEKSINGTSINKIRSIASSFNSLDGKIFRKFCLISIKNICSFRFGNFVEFNKKYNAYIVHPGAKKTIF
jgi:predicted glycoside hydrolase/deacetylase ChbG (UPF0249 family)